MNQKCISPDMTGTWAAQAFALKAKGSGCVFLMHQQRTQSCKLYHLDECTQLKNFYTHKTKNGGKTIKHIPNPIRQNVVQIEVMQQIPLLPI